MIFRLRNTLKEQMDVILEPSADLISLKHEDVLEILTEPDIPQSEITVEMLGKGLAIWIPKNVSIGVFVNGAKIDTLYEEFEW